MKHIMVATDFSERSDRALRRAILLAWQAGGYLTLINAVDDDRPPRIVDEEKREANALISEISGTVRGVDGVPCDGRVILAEPSQAIIHAARQLHPDLLVIGPHRRQLFRDVFIGTTAERIIREAPCPVLMVNGTPAAAYRHIMMTTDLSEGSRRAVASFVGLHLAGSAHQSMLHVYDAPMLRLAMTGELPVEDKNDYKEAERAKAYSALVEFLSSAQAPYFASVVRRETNTTHHEILAAAGEVGADLIVLSAHAIRGLEKMLLGSVTEQVLKDSPVDVLVIPRDRQY